MWQRRKARGAEGVGKQGGVGALRAVVQVPRGGLDVGVAHPRLDLHEGCLVDGHGSEEVAQRMERQAPQSTACCGCGVATAKRVCVEVAAERRNEDGVLKGLGDSR